VTLGLLICCYGNSYLQQMNPSTDKIIVIESSTVESDFKPTTSHKYRVITLQKSSLVGDELFGSYAIPSSTNIIRTSRLNSKEKMAKYEWLLNSGAFFMIAGFVLQLVGVLSLDWSVSTILVGTSIMMLFVRMWSCR
jgi:hypothetical protein